MTARPDLIILGQVTIDDVVPAAPGPWTRQMGGSSLYAIAGARLWIEPERIGLVARIGTDYPFDTKALLAEAGVQHVALRPVASEHLVEWLIYEPDGSRRCLPRNAGLLDIGAEGSSLLAPYFDVLLAITPEAKEIPAEWLPAQALHLCPQVGTRHRDSLAELRGKVGWISVDPSPHYSRDLSPTDLAERLAGATALLPSAQEVRPLTTALGDEDAALALHRAGFAEVALKRGGDPVLLAVAGSVQEVPTVEAAVVDPTGAGDSFCGAYAACRLIGCSPEEAARRAAATAALIVGCTGVEAALRLQPLARETGEGGAHGVGG
jgi:ribokinase